VTKDEAIKKLNEIREIVLKDTLPVLTLRMDILTVLSDVPSGRAKRSRPPMRVSVNGVMYASLEDAAQKLKLYPITVRNRIVSQNEKFKDWTFVYTP
jgi:hypothetical protein